MSNPNTATQPDALTFVMGFRPKTIPDELKTGQRFTPWKYEIDRGRLTKVPYSLAGPRAKPNEPTTWATFDACLLRYQHEPGEWCGIGTMLLGGSIAVADLDKCRSVQTEIVNVEAQAIIDALDSYTEVSTSGTGIHVYVIANGVLDDTRARVRVGVNEFYTPRDARFITLTGIAP